MKQLKRRPKKTESVGQDFDATITKQLHSLLVEVGSLVHDPNNARLHDERNIEAIRASLKRYKQRKPIVVHKTKRVVIAGNGTLTAAKREGWSHIAAVEVEDSDSDAAGFAIADNRTADLAEWSYPTIGDLVDRFNLDALDHALGFSAEELSSIVASHRYNVKGERPSIDELEDDGEDLEESSKPVPTVIKVKVLDSPYRAKIQAAIQELIDNEFSGLAHIK